MQTITLDWSHVLTIVLAIFGGSWALIKSTNKKFEGLDKKFDAIDKKFDAIDKKFDSIDKKIDILSERSIRMEEQLRNLDHRISTIEGYLVPKKVFHFEESPKEEPKEN